MGSTDTLDATDPENFGTTIAGSRWFDGDPDISRKRMVPVRERWRCPMEACDGEMRFNGSVWPTGRQGYHHTCNECGFTAAIRGKKYPRITHVEPNQTP